MLLFVKTSDENFPNPDKFKLDQCNVYIKNQEKKLERNKLYLTILDNSWMRALYFLLSMVGTSQLFGPFAVFFCIRFRKLKKKHINGNPFMLALLVSIINIALLITGPLSGRSIVIYFIMSSLCNLFFVLKCKKIIRKIKIADMQSKIIASVILKKRDKILNNKPTFLGS